MVLRSWDRRDCSAPAPYLPRQEEQYQSAHRRWRYGSPSLHATTGLRRRSSRGKVSKRLWSSSLSTGLQLAICQLVFGRFHGPVRQHIVGRKCGVVLAHPFESVHQKGPRRRPALFLPVKPPAMLGAEPSAPGAVQDQAEFSTAAITSIRSHDRAAHLTSIHLIS